MIIKISLRPEQRQTLNQGLHCGRIGLFCENFHDGLLQLTGMRAVCLIKTLKEHVDAFLLKVGRKRLQNIVLNPPGFFEIGKQGEMP